MVENLFVNEFGEKAVVDLQERGFNDRETLVKFLESYESFDTSVKRGKHFELIHEIYCGLSKIYDKKNMEIFREVLIYEGCVDMAFFNEKDFYLVEGKVSKGKNLANARRYARKQLIKGYKFFKGKFNIEAKLRIVCRDLAYDSLYYFYDVPGIEKKVTYRLKTHDLIFGLGLNINHKNGIQPPKYLSLPGRGS